MLFIKWFAPQSRDGFQRSMIISGGPSLTFIGGFYTRLCLGFLSGYITMLGVHFAIGRVAIEEHTH